MITEIYTIGVYGQTEDEFFSKLAENNVDTFCDIRRRRAVRGSTYSFVNSTKLQQKLKNMKVDYLHFLDLAPSKETREQQKQADKDTNTTKRQREGLSLSFIKAYENECLVGFDVDEFISRIGQESKKVVLFCVEQSANACHRSLVAEKLAEDLNLKIVNL